jgi:hypothetical protein
MTAPAAREPAGYGGLFHVSGTAVFAEIAAKLATERGEAITRGMRTLLGDQVLGHIASGRDA